MLPRYGGVSGAPGAPAVPSVTRRPPRIPRGARRPTPPLATFSGLRQDTTRSARPSPTGQSSPDGLGARTRRLADADDQSGPDRASAGSDLRSRSLGARRSLQNLPAARHRAAQPSAAETAGVAGKAPGRPSRIRRCAEGGTEHPCVSTRGSQLEAMDVCRCIYPNERRGKARQVRAQGTAEGFRRAHAASAAGGVPSLPFAALLPGFRAPGPPFDGGTRSINDVQCASFRGLAEARPRGA